MPFIGFGNQRQITSHFLIPMIIWTPCTWGRQCFIHGTPCTLVRPFYWDTLNLGKTIFIGTPCTWEDQFYWNTLNLGKTIFIGTPCTGTWEDQFYWDTLYLGMANFIETPFTWGRPCLLGHPSCSSESPCLLGHPVYLRKTMFIGTPCIPGKDNVYWHTLYNRGRQFYWDTLYNWARSGVLGHLVPGEEEYWECRWCED